MTKTVRKLDTEKNKVRSSYNVTENSVTSNEGVSYRDEIHRNKKEMKKQNKTVNRLLFLRFSLRTKIGFLI